MALLGPLCINFSAHFEEVDTVGDVIELFRDLGSSFFSFYFFQCPVSFSGFLFKIVLPSSGVLLYFRFIQDGGFFQQRSALLLFPTK